MGHFSSDMENSTKSEKNSTNQRSLKSQLTFLHSMGMKIESQFIFLRLDAVKELLHPVIPDRDQKTFFYSMDHGCIVGRFSSGRWNWKINFRQVPISRQTFFHLIDIGRVNGPSHSCRTFFIQENSSTKSEDIFHPIRGLTFFI